MSAESRADEARGCCIARAERMDNEQLILLALARILAGDGLDWRLCELMQRRAGLNVPPTDAEMKP